MRRLAFLPILFALLWLPAWANFGDGQAYFSSGDYKGALEAWRPLAEAGDPRAQYSLGILYEQGLGMEKDLEQAKGWYERAAKADYAPAAAALRAVLAKLEPEPEPEPPAAAPTGTRPATAAQLPAPPPRALSEREQIEALVHELMRQANLQMRSGQLSYDKVAVTEVSDGFEVDVYAIVLLDNDGKQIDIGDVGARITRQGERYYQIGFLLPTTIYGREPGEEQSAEITIGQQTNSMLWDRDLEIVVDFDFDWRDLAVVDPKGHKVARISSVAMRSDMKENEERWSGPVVFDVQGVEVMNGNEERFSLGKFGFRTIVDRLDMVRYAAISRAVAQGQQTPEQTIQALEQLLSGIAVEFNLEDLAVERPSQEPIRLASANYRLGLDGLDQALASLNMSYDHGGLKGTPPEVPELAPREAKIRFAFVRLPIATLLQSGVAAVLEYMFFGEVGSQGDVLNQLRMALSEARTELRIEDGRFEAPTLEIGLGGVLSADAQAVWGLAGDVGLTILGLDTLIDAYLKNGPRRPQGAPPSSLPALLKHFGKISGDGRTYIYNFQVTREGKVLVNGQDAMPLVAAFFSG
ncbi:MAG: hypothetical protein QF893_11030 [Alphaproteobacteria bacterium]|jgi:hypothetical protein|nr:hypothetical protein [Alphaproteobacteria bacterium]